MAAALSIRPSSLSRPLRLLSRSLEGLLPFSWRQNSLAALATSRSANEGIQTTSTPAFSWPTLIALPSLLAPLLELFPSIVLAVPKKKVSHSRKSMRSANKGLKDKLNIVACPACGGPKLSHNLCPSCASQLFRGFKADNRPPPASS